MCACPSPLAQAFDLLPTMLEFGTFSLLAMFFVYILLEDRDEWGRRRGLVLWLFFGCNLVVLALNVAVFTLFLRINDVVLPVWISQVCSGTLLSSAG
jgi:hypothetical protein